MIEVEKPVVSAHSEHRRLGGCLAAVLIALAVLAALGCILGLVVTTGETRILFALAAALVLILLVTS